MRLIPRFLHANLAEYQSDIHKLTARKSWLINWKITRSNQIKSNVIKLNKIKTNFLELNFNELKLNKVKKK